MEAKSEQKRLAQTVTLWYINLCKQILVPGVTAYARSYHNRTLHGTASRAVTRTAAGALWSLTGQPHPALALCGEEPDRDCRVPFLLALERLSCGARLSRRSTGLAAGIFR